MSDHTYEAGYLAKLRANAADPSEATILRCKLGCDWAVLIRHWPADGPEALAVFLDGLAEMAETTGHSAYGFWHEDDAGSRGPDQRLQIWRAADRALVFAGRARNAPPIERHVCPFGEESE